jgi:hypothetical protein
MASGEWKGVIADPFAIHHSRFWAGVTAPRAWRLRSRSGAPASEASGSLPLGSLAFPRRIAARPGRVCGQGHLDRDAWRVRYWKAGIFQELTTVTSSIFPRLCLLAALVLPAAARAEERTVQDLLLLLQSGVSAEVAALWVSSGEIAAPPSAEQLVALKAAGAGDELLLALLRRAGGPVAAPPPVARSTTAHRIRAVERVDVRSGRRVLELTNQAEDGSFPPPPPDPLPQKQAAAVTEERLEIEAAPLPPGLLVAPEPVLRRAPPAQRTGTTRLSIIPPRVSSVQQSANPPGHHERFFGRDGYHFPHFPYDIMRNPIFYVFDFNVPFFPRPETQPPAPAPKKQSGYRPHERRYRSRSTGFEHR